MRPHGGEAEPLGRATPPRKCNKNQEPHQGQPTGPTQPRTTPTPPSKGPHQSHYNYLPNVPPPIPLNSKKVSPTKNLSRTPSAIKALKNSHGRESTHFNKFKGPLPRRVGVH